MSEEQQIIQSAFAARSLEDAVAVQELIAAAGARYERPLGDRWTNLGLITRGGSPDHKLIELVTNGQDGLLEFLALQRFGDSAKVPYKTPHEAASALLGGMHWQDAAGLMTVTLAEAGGPPKQKGRLTPVFRDKGCGITPGYVPQSIFYLGSRHKGKAHWQQGAFGIGGASTFCHAEAVVLVTRRHPDLLDGTEDRITVAVCLWEEYEKGRGLYYLVTTDWADGNNPNAEPWSAPASAFPDFEPGTHIALVGYEGEKIHKAQMGGEWSFEKLLNTRLFKPVTPVRVDNQISKKAHPQNYRGLCHQFEENPRKDRKEFGPEPLPFRLGDKTYQLPVSAYVFEAGPRADVGGKRGFVNSEHALMFVSNGQVHHHWSPQELKRRTGLNHVYDRVLIVVELDSLPIKARNNLVAPDRLGFIASEHTRRLQELVVQFVREWDELTEFDRELLRRALAGDHHARSTVNVARQIARALQFKGGFALAASSGNGSNKSKRRKKLAKAELYPDPTTIEGPQSLTIEQGATRMTRFHINARDKFMASGRGEFVVTSDHPELGDDEITVGTLHDGFVRVMIAVPDAARLGDFELTASLTGWSKAAGGTGADLVWATRLKIVEPLNEEARQKPRRRGGDEEAPTRGSLVALRWRTEDDFDDWHAGVPGHVEDVPASDLATSGDDYKELATLGDAKIPTIFLNEHYTPLTRYEAARTELSQRGRDDARERYAVGAGLALLVLHRDFKAKQAPPSPELELAAKQAGAQATLVMMPQYDRLAREAGLVEDE